MSGILPTDLRLRVIRPVCISLGLDGDAAEELLLGTAAQESGCGARLVQNGGPALGVFQMEPKTHDDIWANFLDFRHEMASKVLGFAVTGIPKTIQLIGNLYYACAMARIQYFRSPKALPDAGDIEGQAQMYCAVYNTILGKATTEEYVRNAKIALGLR